MGPSTRALTATFRRLDRSLGWVGVAAIAVGIALGIVVPGLPGEGAVLVGVVLGIASIAVVGAVTLRDPALRAGLEIYFDHNRTEREAWRRRHGARHPRTRREIERWVAENPRSRDRLSLLTLLGRFEEVDEQLRHQPPRTQDQVCGDEIDRQYRVLFTGGPVDLAAARGRWSELEDPVERHHRRECLALLEAQVASASGQEPLATLRSAREEVGPVALRSRVWFLVATAMGIALAIAIVVGLLRIVIVPA